MSNPCPSPKLSIICFGDYWDQARRRRQEVVSRLARRPEVERVLYVELPLTLLSLVKYILGCADSDARTRWAKVLTNGCITTPEPRLFVVTTFSIFPLFRLPLLQKLNAMLYKSICRWLVSRAPQTNDGEARSTILWLTHPGGRHVLGEFGRTLVVYDYTDDISLSEMFTAAEREHYLDLDRLVTNDSDVLFVQSESQYADKVSVCPNTHVIENGVDLELFRQADANGSVPKPVELSHYDVLLGYCGSLGPRLDTNIVKDIALARPNWGILLMGEINNHARHLESVANVHFTGFIPYGSLPEHIRWCDACLMPYDLRFSGGYGSPLKLFAYLALGKPVVSTPIPSIAGLSCVEFARTGQDFIRAIESVGLSQSSEVRAQRIAVAEEHSWERIVDRMLDRVCRTLKARD